MPIETVAAVGPTSIPNRLSVTVNTTNTTKEIEDQ